MNGAEKLIKVMSDICKYEESKIILGTYNKGGAITEEMEIPKEMCYKFDYLLEKRAKKVSGTISSSGGETHTQLDRHKRVYRRIKRRRFDSTLSNRY